MFSGMRINNDIMVSKYLISALLSLSPLLMMAKENPDTVTVIENASAVTVVKSGDSTILEAVMEEDSIGRKVYRYELEIGGQSIAPADTFPDDWGMDLPFMREKNRGKSRCLSRRVTGFRHLYWGWRFNYGNKGSVKNCFEVGIRDVIGVAWQRGGSELEIGLGFSMQRYLADDGMAYRRNSDALRLESVPEGKRCKLSRLDIWTFQVPVLYNQKIGGDVSFSLGGVLNFNTYAKAQTKLRYGDITEKTTYKGLHQNLFTADIIGAVHVSGIGVYAAWSPMHAFKKEYGPAVSSWSLGIDLCF